MDPISYTLASTEEDLQGIIDLQLINLRKNLTEQ